MKMSEMYFYEMRVYRKVDQNYWTIGVMTSGTDFEDSARVIMAWCAGALCAENIESIKIQSCATHKTRGRGYMYPNDAKLIEEIQLFLAGAT